MTRQYTQPEAGPVIEEQGSAPQQESARHFTIQVAAYLKEKDAARYVKMLHEKGQDAFYTRAGKGAKTWFQVKISSFPTKTEAQAFGRKLKNKGIIDDFYVANYDALSKRR